MSEPEQPPTPNRAAPIPLWRIAAFFLRALFGLFGDASDVATRHTLTHEAHKLLARWIGAGEALLRRLLLIEARALDLKPAAARKSRKRVRRLFAFYPDAPEDWRVCFPLMPAPARRGLARRGGARLANRFRAAWPLALRYEALLRVFNEPLPYARRLARRLARDIRIEARVLDIPERFVPLIGEENIAQLDRATPAPRWGPGGGRLEPG